MINIISTTLDSLTHQKLLNKIIRLRTCDTGESTVKTGKLRSSKYILATSQSGPLTNLFYEILLQLGHECKSDYIFNDFVIKCLKFLILEASISFA